LASVLAKYSKDEIVRNVALGPEESFVQIEVRPKNMTAYIYEDGAGLLGLGIDKRFERYDYADLKELQRAFLSAAREVF
jgi:hypothetical protein